MALRSGEHGSERRDGDRLRVALDREPSEAKRTALMWLELAEGSTREALVERLAQARMSGSTAEALVETLSRGTLEDS